MKILQYLSLLNIFFSIMIVEFAFSQSISVNIPDDVIGDPNTSVIIPIEVGDLTNQDVIAYQAVIAFDNSVLDATGAFSEGTVSGTFGPPTVNISEAGVISVGGFGTSPLSGAGFLVNLNFKVIGQPGETTELVFNNFIFNSGDPLAETQNGKFSVSIPTGVPVEPSLPVSFVLKQNYPNPFNPQTSIAFEVPAIWNSPITLQVFNFRGQLVKTLLDGAILKGKNLVVWNSKDNAGNPVSSGQYLYKISSGNFVKVRKMLLVK